MLCTVQENDYAVEQETTESVILAHNEFPLQKREMKEMGSVTYMYYRVKQCEN